MVNILVIGSPSLDTLHFNQQTVEAPGGAGLYTAMAAHRSGANVSLFAPRPNPMPPSLLAVNARLTAWLGPTISPDDLPHFTISHHGDKAEYLEFFVGAEAEFDASMLNFDVSGYDAIHIIPLGNAKKQQSFIKACRKHGGKFISAGTFFRDVSERRKEVLENISLTDVFFMNEEEAVCLFGSLTNAKTECGKILYLTLGEKGVIVVQGEHQTHLKAIPAKVLDPTGAGDTFCGAALFHLVAGMHPIMAAYQAMALAAQEIEFAGATALLQDAPPPTLGLDLRVSIDEAQVDRVASIISKLPEAHPYNFVGNDFPPVNHPATLDYFFCTILQQFGFWQAENGHYQNALIAPINGEMLKGSFYLFRAYLRQLAENASFFTPAGQANINLEQYTALLKDDNGKDVMPVLPLHYDLARRYGQDMITLGYQAEHILACALQSSTPLKTFFRFLDQISGYKEDPLRKKSGLLALTLNQRPEVFFEFGSAESVAPVIDYHAMRSALRLGLVQVHDKHLLQKLQLRKLVEDDEEWAVRFATYLMQQKVVSASGKSQGAVDWFFFNYMRSRCYENEKPACNSCAADPICAHQKELFQPVFRTTFY